MSTLSDKAVVVRLSLTAWEGSKMENACAAGVESANGAKRGTIKVVKSDLLPNGCGTERDMVWTLLGEARSFHYANTLRWMNRGEQLVTVEHFTKAYMPKMNMMKDRTEAAHRIFVQAFPQRMIEAAQMRGALYKPTDYPSTRALERRFCFDVAAYPVPSSNALANILGGEVAANMEAELDKAVADAMQDAYARLHDAVSSMATKLSDPKAIFRDTLVGNVEALCNILPGLNVAGDARLDSFIEEIKGELLAHKPDVLRDGGCARAEVASRAVQISEKLRAFALNDEPELEAA